MPGGLPGPVGITEVADQAARTKHEVDVIALALYSLHGFSSDLVDLADRRDDLLLVDLPTLYGS